MESKLSHQNILKLIHLYKSHPNLWDINNKLYHSTELKYKAYEDIAKEMGMLVDVVKRKIRNLRTTYTNEKRKMILKKTGSGAEEQYVTSLSWYNEMSFLDTSIVIRKTMDHSAIEVEPQPKKKKTCSSTDELVRAATLRLKPPQDFCHQITIVWGNKLSKMDRNQRIIAEKVINEVMFNGELGLLNFDTTLNNLTSTCNLNPSLSSFSKKNTIENTNESSLESQPTNNYANKYCRSLTPNDSIRQRFSTDNINYSSPSPPIIRPEPITDNENDETTQNFIVSEYDPLDNSIKIEN